MKLKIEDPPRGREAVPQDRQRPGTPPLRLPQPHSHEEVRQAPPPPPQRGLGVRGRSQDDRPDHRL